MSRRVTMRTIIGRIAPCGFEGAFQSGGTLDIRVRPGDCDIAGSDQPKVSVSCELKFADRAKDVKIKFGNAGGDRDLRISGGPRGARICSCDCRPAT